MIKFIVYFTVCLHLFLIGAMAQTTPDIIEYQDGTVIWTNSNSALYYTVEWQSSLTDDSWTGSYRSLQDLQSTQSLVAVAVPQFFRISGKTNPAVTKTLSSTSSVQEAGYYEETDLADIDADLMADNIKSGVTIFGITGTYESASSPSTSLTQAQVDALALWANTLIETSYNQHKAFFGEL